MKTLYKSLKKGCLSNHNDHKWELNKWYKIDGELDICNNGFHVSKNIIDAIGYVNCEVLAKVEVRGKSIIQDDKECWEEMRIIKKWKWTKKDSVVLAIYSAELVINNFEKEYPNDKRPREAIEAAKKWLKNPTKKNQEDAAAVVYSAYSAYTSSISPYTSSASNAAYSAYAAVSLASAAAYSVSAVVAYVIAYSALRNSKNTKQKIHNYIIKNIL